MAESLVSVVIPCYRQGHYLPQTLEDVFAQSYPNIEVVLVNDGSDDDTAAVAERYRGRIRYVWQSNAGLSAARNTGIAHARGKYLFCLDSDDRIHPDAIGWLVEAAAGRDDVLCVMGCQFYERDDDLHADIERYPVRERPLGLALMEWNVGPPHAYLSSREMVLAQGCFDTALKSCEDWDLWVRLVFAGAEVVPILRVGAYYRRHPNSMSRNRVRMALTAAEVLGRTLRGITRNPQVVRRLGGSVAEMRTAVRRRLTEELVEGAYHLRQQGEYLGALKAYTRSLIQGSATRQAATGMGKLLPHWVLHRLLATRPALG